MKQKLKPCPFCGGKVIVIIDGYADVGCWVKCENCGATAGQGSELHEEAIKAWDRRPK